ncbi:beta strand repeat-containing protein [Methanosphaera sp.]
MHLSVSSGSNLNLTNATVTGVSQTAGGGLYNGGTTIINNVTFSSNSASNGGAIYTSGSLTIKNSRFINNTASTRGGAIYFYNGQLSVTNTTFINNSASTTARTGLGGAIMAFKAATITNCTFTNNRAIAGGAICVGNGTVINKCVFTNNKADTTNTSYSGGAIYNLDSILTINNSIFANNSAPRGGVIYNSRGTITINNSTFTNNSAIERAGVIHNHYDGILYVYNSTFTNNSAVNGGVIHNFADTDSYVTINNSRFINNSASDVGGVISNNATVTVGNSTFTNNSANIGGAIYNSKTQTILTSNFTNNKAVKAGAIYADYASGSGNINIDRCVFTNNTATSKNTSDEVIGGALVNNGTLTMTNVNFTSNTARDQGGAIYSHRAFTMTNSTFRNNNANEGGAIYNRAGVTITNANFISNNATNRGGVIFNSARNVVITNANFTNNKAGDTGGAINTRGIVTLNNLQFINNTAQFDGGAIYNNYTITINNSTFTKNNSTRGGAISNNGTETCTINGSRFISNNATRGGAIHSNSNITVTNSNLTNNNATLGGVIFNNEANATLSGVNITNNSALYYGVIYSKGNFTLENSKLDSNYVTGTHFVIHPVGNITIRNNLFINNTDNKRDMLLKDPDFGDKFIVQNNTYIDNLLNDTINTKNYTVYTNNTQITVNMAIRSVYNDTVRNGTITAYLNGDVIGRGQVVNGTANISLSLKELETFVILRYNSLSKHYQNNTSNTNVSIVKYNSTTTAKILNNTIGNVTVNVTVKNTLTGEDVITGDIIVRDDNGDIVGNASVINGNAVVKTNITKSGDITLNVAFSGTSKYMNSSTTLNANIIGSITQLTVNTINNTFGNTSISVTLTDTETTQTIANAQIIVTLPNGTNITTQTSENGEVTIPIDIPVGENTVTVTYPGQDTYVGATTTQNINVIRRETTTSAIILNNTAGNVTINVTVVDTTTGNPLNDSSITIRDNNNTVVATGLIVNGYAVVICRITTMGDYTLTVDYMGNTNYTPSSTTLDDVTIVGKDATLDVNIINNTIGNTSISVIITDTETGDAIADADIIVTLPNGVNTTTQTNENGEVIIPLNIPAGDNNITVTYTGNSTYNTKNTTINVFVNKFDSIITVDPVTGIIGENITLTAHVTDIDGNPITGGNVVFKLNGKTLKVDGSFNSTANPLKFSVVDGTVTYTLTADLYLRNAKNLSASYSGTSKYSQNTSEVTTAQIAKRNTEITVTTDNLVKQDTDIELVATVTDTTRNGQNTTAVNEGYVVFKVNGVSIKDADGNVIRVKVENNTATYTYHVPIGMASVDGQGNLRNYTVEAVYQSDIFYPDARNTTVFNVEKSNVTVNINSVIINNSTKTITQITGNMTDYHGNLLVGSNKVCIKVNGKSLKDNNNNTMYFTVTNGIIDLSNINTNGVRIFDNITIVTGENNVYMAGQATTTELTIV